MGRSETTEPSSPFNRSNSSFHQGPQFPVTFTDNVSRKKWIALGLSVVLIVVLLIAVIILATSKAPPPSVPPCPKENSSSLAGENDALHGDLSEKKEEGPHLEESKMAGIPEIIEEKSTEMEKSSTSTPAQEFSQSPWDAFGDDFDADFGAFPPEDDDENSIDFRNFDTETSTKIEETTTFESEFESESGETTTSTTESTTPLVIDTFWSGLDSIDQNDLKVQGRILDDNLDPKLNENPDLDSGNGELSPEDLAKLLHLIRDMSKEDQRSEMIQKFGNSSSVRAKLEDLMVGKQDLHEDEELAVAAAFVMTKDLHTPDDNHKHDFDVEKKQKFTAEVMSKYLEFASPNTGSKEDSKLTVGTFFTMVESLIDILKNLKAENDTDSIEEYLHFMENLRSDIELLNKTQHVLDIRHLYNNSAIERVNRLWADYVSSSNNIVFAKIQQALKEVGVSNLNDTAYNWRQLHALKQEQLKKQLQFQEGNMRTSLDGLGCDPETELACDDGKGCFSISKRCDRYIDCLYDRSDEKNCSCRLYLDQGRICDGYPDCQDGSDEMGCFCKASQHFCGLHTDGKFTGMNQCIDGELRCDNVIDCANSNDEMNCFALSSSSLSKQMFPRQEIQGLLHIQRSFDWYIFAIDIEPGQKLDKFKPLLDELSKETCQSTITRGENNPSYDFVEPPLENEILAHLMVNLEDESNLNRFYTSAGRFDFSLKPAFPKTTKVISVSCGEPKCGQSVNDGNDPFSVLSQGPKKDKKDNEGVDLRIVGGEDARPTKWPFALSLHRNGYFKCGASIIAPDWILTAAHCVYNFTFREDYFEVRGGIYRQRSDVSMETVRKLERIFIYPEYDDSQILHDIALAKVDRPFPMDTFTASVCLPSFQDDVMNQAGLEAVPKAGDNCLAVGWGLLDDAGANRDVADTLQEVQVPILDKCEKSNSNGSMYICGGFAQGGKDTCQGDSGGPLFCQDMSKPFEAWYQAGVISHGKGCALPEEASYYTRVAFYKDWIQEVMDGLFTPRSNNAAVLSCPSGVTCDNGRCVGQVEVCDFHADCFDGLDEEHCLPHVVNGQVVYRLKPGVYGPQTTTSRPALPDLSESQDSRTYPVGPYSYHAMKYGQHKPDSCPPGSFICKNVRQCIPNKLRCDLTPDCIDGTDEKDCACRDYFSVHAPELVCDGHPDCYDFTDELGCHRCQDDSFYCHLSQACIPKAKLCDEKYDCRYHEDERYCMALTKTDYLNVDISGKPYFAHHGYIAVNYKGNWRFICVGEWKDSTSNTICQYLGYVSSDRYDMVANHVYPHLQLGHLPLEHAPHKMYRRSLSDNHQGHGEGQQEVAISGRQASCQFVDLTCKNSRTCGQLPLYSSMGEDTPTFGPGVTPWKAEIYVEGVHTCGASLVNPRWLLTHSSCAEATLPFKSNGLEAVPQKYSVARLGAYRDNEPDLNFLSGHEQVIRIARSLIIPDSDIALIKLETEAELTEHVHTICLPNSEWVPTNINCYIHGRHAGVFNHAIKTQVTGKCNQDGANFDICAKQQNPSGECLDNWTGTLICPDFSGNFYAVGIYNSGPADQCQDNDNSGSNVPQEFISVVGVTAREAILELVASNAGDDFLTDETCDIDEGRFRCPLGSCLDKSQICDGIPQCEDASDENPGFCTEHIRMCEQVNATHCQCNALDDMMCDNLMCLHKSKFCDGVNDCGDRSDEPANCEHDCSIGLAAYAPDQICDGQIDCKGLHDLANDESVERCCTSENTLNNFRCALGHYPGNVSISDECIPRKCVCDWDADPGTCPSCMNGADEVDCMSIHGHKKYDELKPKTPALDAFGRSKTQNEGFVYFTAHGQDHLYCASPKVFTEPRLKAIGQALCKHENFDGLNHISLIHPLSRTKIEPSYVLPAKEQPEYDHCKMIFLSCLISSSYK